MLLIHYMENKVKKYLRQLENPYASLQINDDIDDEFVLNSAANKAHSERNRPIHPYATLASPEELDTSSPLDGIAPPKHLILVKTISKEGFRKRCRLIFQQYIPSLEGNQLRQHHRDFISRNESRSPEERYSLLSELEKYNLASLRGVNTLFNREQDIFTEKKLKSIENLVDKK